MPASLINLLSGQISIKYNLKGPNHSVVTACSTGAHSIGDSAEIIKRGAADIMVAGGAEAAVCRIGIAGFCAARSLSTNFNEEPEKASRPWDKDRDGFVMGEGAGVLILEELKHAKKRQAKIYMQKLLDMVCLEMQVSYNLSKFRWRRWFQSYAVSNKYGPDFT